MLSPLKSFARRMILTRQAKEPEPKARERAIEELGEIGDPKDFELIAAALRDEVIAVRKAAAHALAQLGDPRAVPTFAGILSDPNLQGAWQSEVIAALEKMRDARGVESCVTSMTSREAKVRRAAAAALGNMGATVATETLTKALKDDDAEVVREAINALSKIGKPAVPMLIKILEQEFGNAKQGAAEALGIIGDERAIPPLIAALKDKDSFLQIAVAKALSKFDDPRVVGPLIEALEESATAAFFYGVREEAEMGLIKMGKRALEPLTIALRNPETRGRPFIVKVIGQISDPGGLEVLKEAARDSDAEVRQVAVKSWMTRYPKEGMEIAFAALDDPNVIVRSAAADALTKTGWRPTSSVDQARHLAAQGRYQQALESAGAETMPILLRHLQDANAGTRREVARLFGRLRNPQFLEILRLAALKDQDTEVQRALVETIKAHGPASIESLIMLLENGSWFLRRLAGRALAALDWTPTAPPHLVLYGLATNDTRSLGLAAETAPELLADALTESTAFPEVPENAPAANEMPPLRMQRP